jgi:hypothetical protein
VTASLFVWAPSGVVLTVEYLIVETESAEYALAEDSIHAVSSNLSSLNGDAVGDIRWSGTHELSNATEVLLHNIKHSDSRTAQPRVVIEEPSDAYTSDLAEIDLGEESTNSDGVEHEQDTRYHEPSYLQQPAVHPQQSSLRDRANRMSVQDKRKAVHESWRASLEDNQFGQLEATHDPMELQRQQVIWEFHASEEAFVDTLQTVLRLFVQPLRTQHQRQWIAGLAPDIMRLFDWLDDIANLHEQLLGVLDSLQQDQSPVTACFSEAVRQFVPLMELYQPYAIRVDGVSKRIISMALDPTSDFGEFVRIQSALLEHGQKSLEDMLTMPVKRLQDYVDVFEVSTIRNKLPIGANLETLATSSTHPAHAFRLFSCILALPFYARHDICHRGGQVPGRGVRAHQKFAESRQRIAT